MRCPREQDPVRTQGLNFAVHSHDCNAWELCAVEIIHARRGFLHHVLQVYPQIPFGKGLGYLVACRIWIRAGYLQRLVRWELGEGKLKPAFFQFVLLGHAAIVPLIGWRFDLSSGEMIDSASVGDAVQHGVFNSVSVLTTTGFATADTNQWPFLAHAVLILLMFVGGCAGSTAGGIKVIRVWIAVKVMFSEIERVFRPQVIRPVRVGRTIIDTDLKLGTLAYVLGMVLLFAVGSVAVMLIEGFAGSGRCDYMTAATASLACLCTIGPGLAQVGAIENYGWMTTESKLLLSLLMALGRLEVFAIIVLFSPRFWRGD